MRTKQAPGQTTGPAAGPLGEKTSGAAERPELELLNLRSAIADELRRALTLDDVREIVAAAIAEARGHGPSASKARRFLLDAMGELSGDELAVLRRDAGLGAVFSAWGQAERPDGRAEGEGG